MNENKEINHGNGLIEYICYWNSGNICEHYTKLNGLLHGEYRRYNGEDSKLCYHDYNINDEVEGEMIKYIYNIEYGK